ncbi:Gfo/Idh/MocA family protein [Rhabdothermincola sediminis]|uniref:Gfo/Idh/MocA family protein n=1 Tax=Rhabdothermincola sediminis TaxID=2751370 RepID=UPI001AA010A9|nr:Gfo/Idh/MocA family oxidoreductase [Rhabdothermincola sediminis]
MTTVAFAGAGPLTAVHGLAAQALGLRVSHVAAGTAEQAAERASQLRARPCTYEDLPAGADLVIVTAPPAMRASEVLRSVRAGTAVLVEPPLAATLAGADAIVDAAARAAAPVLYGESLLHAPVVRTALDRVRMIGPIDRIEVRAQHTPGDRRVGAEPGVETGALAEVGTRALAVALAVAEPAEPVAVQARLEYAGPGQTDDWAEVTLRFAGGAVATVVASRREPEPAAVWDLQVSSPTGVVRAELAPTPSLEHDGEPVPVVATPAAGDVPQLEQFGYLQQLRTAAAAAGRAHDLRGPILGRKVLEVLCGAYAAAADSGSWHPLPFAGPRDRPPLAGWATP